MSSPMAAASSDAIPIRLSAMMCCASDLRRPLALFQYLLYLLDRKDSILYMLAPLLALPFAIPAYAFWRYGLSRYKSTGS